MSKLATPLYLLAVALMALLLAALWLGPGPLAAWRQWQAPPAQAPNLDDVRTALLRANPAAAAAYPAVLDRPVMNPGRRPAAVAAAPQDPASAPPSAIEQVRLLGIVAGPALNGVMIEQDGKTSFVRRGERVGDWTLDTLQGREASFVRGGERRRIELPIAHATADAKAAPATPQAPARAATGAPAPRTPAPAPAVAVRPAPAPAPAPAAPPAAAASAAPRSGSVAAFGGSAPAKPANPPR